MYFIFIERAPCMICAQHFLTFLQVTILAACDVLIISSIKTQWCVFSYSQSAVTIFFYCQKYPPLGSCQFHNRDHPTLGCIQNLKSDISTLKTTHELVLVIIQPLNCGHFLTVWWYHRFFFSGNTSKTPSTQPEDFHCVHVYACVKTCLFLYTLCIISKRACIPALFHNFTIRLYWSSIGPFV